MRVNYNLEDLKFVYEPGTAIAANSMKIVGNIKAINNKNLGIEIQIGSILKT